MAIPVLIMGKSGSGKSASLRNVGKGWFLINVNNKPLPFKDSSNIVCLNSDDYVVIMQQMASATEKGVKNIVIDDAGYLLTSKFMQGHRGGKGNAQFELYNEIADNYYSLIRFVCDKLPDDVIVYVVMHEDKNDLGECRPKTIGKLLDDKVCVEGMFTIVLHAMKLDGKYVFATRTDGLDVTKSPMGMFDDEYIDNDLNIVSKAVNDYYKEV